MKIGVLTRTDQPAGQDGFRLFRQVTIIGRSRSSDLVLDHHSVSRLHATIDRDEDGDFLRDNQSSNGTRVNGATVLRRRLRDGDRLAVGHLEFIYREIECAESDVGSETRETRIIESEADGEPATDATIDGEISNSPSGYDWEAVNSWQIMRMFADVGVLPMSDILQRIADDIAGVRDVDKVTIHVEARSTGLGSCRIHAGAEPGTPLIPEASRKRVMETGEPLALRGNEIVTNIEELGDAEIQALCLPLTIDHRPGGYLVIEAAERLSSDALRALSAATEAVGLGLTIREAGRSKAAESGTCRDAPRPVEIVGRSAPLLEVIRLAEKSAQADTTVLIRGDSGTGKELIARLIGYEGRRRNCPFVTVHSSAIEETLLGSTMFGHERGAFTGAIGTKKGLFEIAHRGTIFLDEIGDLVPAMQLKLLRVLQEGEFMRLGGTETIRVDVRVIAATNRDLEVAVTDGSFREDLYYRLRVIEIYMPALRDRPQDIIDLTGYFIDQLAPSLGRQIEGFDERAVAALSIYAWPGNIRELRNVIERALVLSEGTVLTVDDLPPEIVQARRMSPSRHAPKPASPRSVAAVGLAAELKKERNYLLEVLDECQGNKTEAAARLGIGRSTLYERLESLADSEAE